MGDVSDIGDLLSKWRHEKTMKLVWSVGTVVFTVLSTTATVSWKMRGYVDELEHENEKLRGEIRVIAKAAEAAEKDAEEALKDARDARVQADKAMLYAQLTSAQITKKDKL
jgi:uncharacterized membrane protein